MLKHLHSKYLKCLNRKGNKSFLISRARGSCDIKSNLDRYLSYPLFTTSNPANPNTHCIMIIIDLCSNIISCGRVVIALPIIIQVIFSIFSGWRGCLRRDTMCETTRMLLHPGLEIAGSGEGLGTDCVSSQCGFRIENAVSLWGKVWSTDRVRERVCLHVQVCACVYVCVLEQEWERTENVRHGAESRSSVAADACGVNELTDQLSPSPYFSISSLWLRLKLPHLLMPNSCFLTHTNTHTRTTVYPLIMKWQLFEFHS